MEVIYVASPYTHEDKEVVDSRMRKVSQYCLHLIKIGGIPLSPLNLGDSISQHAEVGTSFGDWEEYCKRLSTLCSEVHVLELEGHESSAGVLQEIEWFESYGIDIIRISEESLRSIGIDDE